MLLNVSRSSAALSFNFNEDTLALQDEVEIRGVTYNRKLTFTSHIVRLAGKASRELLFLRSMLWLFNGRELKTHDKVQVCSSLEYACFAWGEAHTKHLALLNKIQTRGVSMIKDSNAGQEPHLHTLQHPLAVAGLIVVFTV